MLALLPASPTQELLEHPALQSSRTLQALRGIDWTGQATEWGLRIGVALLVLGVGIWLSKLLARVVAGVLVRFNVEGILVTFLRNLTRAVCLVVVVITAMDLLGLPTTSLLAVVGAAGLGIGLALKDSLSNISAGVMLIALRPFKIGDTVEAAGLTGVVEQVRIFQTVLRTADNRVIILPNGLITAAPITNFTARAQRRVEIAVGIGYEDDIRVARQALLDVARANPRVQAQPAPDVLVSALSASTIDLVMRAWVATDAYADARSELLEATRAGLGECGVSIPFPQQDVHLFHHRAVDPGKTASARTDATAPPASG